MSRFHKKERLETIIHKLNDRKRDLCSINPTLAPYFDAAIALMEAVKIVPMHRALTEADAIKKKAVMAAYRAGVQNWKICLEFRIHKNTLAKWAHEAGISKINNRDIRKRRMTRKDRQLALALHPATPLQGDKK